MYSRCLHCDEANLVGTEDSDGRTYRVTYTVAGGNATLHRVTCCWVRLVPNLELPCLACTLTKNVRAIVHGT